MDRLFSYLKRDSYALPTIFVAVCGIMLPMGINGIPDGFDLLQHLRFAVAYHDAIVRGDIIPAWAGRDNFGYGSIGIRYYPPLAYVFLAFGKLLFGNWYYSFLINVFVWMLSGCVGVYLWSREWAGTRMALFASVLYAVAPYHTFQIYQAVLFAEFAAAGIIPFCFLFLTRVCRQPNRRDTLMLAATTSLLLLSHIPSAIIGGISMGVFAVLLVDRTRVFVVTKHLSIAAFAAICASAFHWIKLVTETGWVLHNSSQYYSSGYYDYQRYFFPMYLISPTERYVERLLWHLDLVIVLTLLFAVLAIVFIIVKVKFWRATPELFRCCLPLAGVFGVSIFMLSLLSPFVWKSVPVFAKLQFPWRWLLISSVAGPVLLAAVLSKLVPDKQSPGRAILYPSLLFAFLLVLFSLTQNALQTSSLTKTEFETQIGVMDNSEACPCWWPIWATGNAFNISEKVASGSRNVLIREWEDTSRRFILEGTEPVAARTATFYHPYWKAAINGNQIPVSRDSSGALIIEIQTQNAEIHLAFEEPRFLSITKALSLITWLILIGFGLTGMSRINLKP